MRLKKYLRSGTVILLSLGLASCNLNKAPEPTTDVNVVYTSVASTMITHLNDQLTQTAQAVPPAEATASPTELTTLAPLPSIPVESTLTPSTTNSNPPIIPSVALTLVNNTPTAASAASGSTAVGCADSIFLEDITIPDGTEVTASTVFQKIWRMKNTGTCDWTGGYKFAFAYGTKFGVGSLTLNLTSATAVPPDGSKDFGFDLTAPSIPNTYTGCWKMQNDQGYWFGQAACVTIKVVK
jgi:hypothetical protein